MILTVIVPAYFPPISECARVLCSDITVIGDTFKYNKHSISNRTAVKTIDGPRWLTIPVLSKKRQGQTIGHACIDVRQPWTLSHWRTIEINYRNSPYYNLYADDIKALLVQNRQHAKLIDILYKSMQFCFINVGLKTKIVHSHQLDHQIIDRTDRVISWLEACHCDTYLLPPNQTMLVDTERLRRARKNLLIASYRSEPYHQQFNHFIPDLSLIDLLFNEGPESVTILKKSIPCKYI